MLILTSPFACIVAQVLAVAVHNHYKRLQNKRMSRSAYPYEGSLANVPSSQLVRWA
jgi:ATP-dependent protease Clp ATPase subunit